MKKMPSLGEQEMDILRYISDRAPVAVKDVALHFEAEKNLARTTVLTVMERLRKKGFLNRSKVGAIYQYTLKMQTDDVISSKVNHFVQKTLGGSVGPLFSYFLSSTDLSDDEIAQLKKLAAKLEQKKGD